MIQRIQSVYLLLTTIVSGLFLKLKFLVLTINDGSQTIFTFSGIYKKTAGGSSEVISRMIPVTLLAILIPLVAFVLIFLYRKRRLQLWLTILLMILEFLFIIAGTAYAVNPVRINTGPMTLSIGSLLPFVAIILTFLAYRSIRRDEELIRSYDRLR